ncbi:Imm21 family immunity protein [Streptomyces sp. WAC07094]|uniref:Imm21 family immunity protein n=1 Tax=Streptomyces sp. WAC07094 TaxID=3072183 RepID=UPI002EC49F8F|nr:Imm21 family immunity protein [Streptomyces sp. WAC07094]
MSDSDNTNRHTLGLTWVDSMGGPLIVVPVSVLHQWSGCTEDGIIVGGTDEPDDYDRACAVEGPAEAISLGDAEHVSALVLGDESATTCYLPEQGAFVRWLGACSETELVAAAGAVLSDEATPWTVCGVRETDGPAVLMDSAEAGEGLGVPYPDGKGRPDEAPVPVAARRWRVRAFYKTDGCCSVGVFQLLPANGP